MNTDFSRMLQSQRDRLNVQRKLTRRSKDSQNMPTTRRLSSRSNKRQGYMDLEESRENQESASRNTIQESSQLAQNSRRYYRPIRKQVLEQENRYGHREKMQSQLLQSNGASQNQDQRNGKRLKNILKKYRVHNIVKKFVSNLKRSTYYIPYEPNMNYIRRQNEQSCINLNGVFHNKKFQKIFNFVSLLLYCTLAFFFISIV